MDGAPSAEEPQDTRVKSLKNLVDKSVTRKAVVVFENTLSKAEVEERRSEAGRNGGAPRGSGGRERPRSAEVGGGCPWGGWVPWGRGSSASEGEWGAPSPVGSHAPRSRSLTRCCPPCDAFLPGFLLPLQRKCERGCTCSKGTVQNCEKVTATERDFQRVQRSLRLLGFEPSDFGILSGRAETTPKCKPRRRCSTLSTKVNRRSISLDSLRVAVKRAWLEDCLDESHRRLLAQAAYEEWYFTKERELREKRQEDRVKRLKTKLKLRDDFERKKQKSEEEFRKWLRRKTGKKKGPEGVFPQNHEKPVSRVMETKEKSEKAFLNWKKTKDTEREKRKREKRKEEEDKIEKEKQKAERKIIAEKVGAFQQWKMKLEENEKKQDAKNDKKKRRQEMEERQRRAEGSQISFQMWKEAKDEQIKQKMKRHREIDRTAREERCAQIEERMYEAEQAFEDWLDQVDSRRQKQFYSMNPYQKAIPWIPA